MFGPVISSNGIKLPSTPMVFKLPFQISAATVNSNNSDFIKVHDKIIRGPIYDKTLNKCKV